MKKILPKLALFICLGSILFAQSVYDTNESNNTQNLSKIKSIFLAYEKFPKKVYIGEVFSIKIKAIIANNDFEELYSQLLYSNNTDIINPDSKWQWFSDNIFYNTFYLKVNDLNATLPSITLNITKNSSIIEAETLKAISPKIIKLNGTNKFSNVIAHSLHVIKYKASQFDDKNIIVVIQMEAEQSNLKDFKLSWVKKDGIDSSEHDITYNKIFYYAIVSNYIQKFDFSYFNILTNKFIKISLPIVINDDSVSTQIDLNPEDRSIQAYKYGLYGFVASFLLILLIRRRKIVYIIFLIGLFALFIYDNNILSSIRIEKNTDIRILPTRNSTIFYKTDRPTYAQVLTSREDYKKVLLSNGKIGWIKDNNVSKN